MHVMKARKLYTVWYLINNIKYKLQYITISRSLTLFVCIFKEMFVYCIYIDTLDCSGRHRYSSHGTGYYPAADAIGGGFYDRLGHPLHTLQVR